MSDLHIFPLAYGLGKGSSYTSRNWLTKLVSSLIMTHQHEVMCEDYKPIVEQITKGMVLAHQIKNDGMFIRLRANGDFVVVGYPLTNAYEDAKPDVMYRWEIETSRPDKPWTAARLTALAYDLENIFAKCYKPIKGMTYDTFGDSPVLIWKAQVRGMSLGIGQTARDKLIDLGKVMAKSAEEDPTEIIVSIGSRELKTNHGTYNHNLEAIANGASVPQNLRVG